MVLSLSKYFLVENDEDDDDDDDGEYDENPLYDIKKLCGRACISECLCVCVSVHVFE